MRPLTRSNQQRRPVSRQVAAVDNSGVSVQKMLVQQQMRNTHFGDGGFGFHTSAKFKGMTNTAALIAAATSGPVDEDGLRDSHSKLKTVNAAAT